MDREDRVWVGLIGLIRENFDAAGVDISAETVASDIDGWDSISHTYLILAIERHFGVELPEREVHELANVGELHRLVAKLVGTGG